MCETMPRSVREVIPGTEELVFRQPYVAGTVVSTCAREGRGRARASYSHPRDNKRISIDECPMMLLPRAQVRHNFNAYTLRRRFTTVADNGFQDLQLSTISVSDWVEAGGRPTHKSALRTPGSRRKSEADSGFGSLKRCVTFEDLSESSLNRSPDELSTSSGGDNKPGNRDDDDGESVLSGASYEDRRTYDLPEHLDSFGDNDKVCVAPNKKKKREQEPPPHPENKHHPGDCNSCPQCQKDDARMRKYFGGVDYFLDWIISKWGKASITIYLNHRAIEAL